MKQAAKTYDVLFRRPFWTSSNRRFFSILAVTIVVEISAIQLSVEKFSKISSSANQILKKKYYAILVKNRDNGTPKPANGGWFDAPKSSKPAAQSRANRKKMAVAHETAGLTARLIFPSSQNKRRNEGATVAKILGSKSAHRAALQTALKKIPGPVDPPSEKTRNPLEVLLSRKKSSQQNIKIFERFKQGKVSMAPPSITDFDVPSGYRTQKQTLVTINKNSQFIRYCLEKFYAGDPTVKGNIVVKFDIHPNGYVVPESVRIIQSGISDPRVIRCIKKNIRRWRNFPKVAMEMGDYTITQKYVF